jgi:hypothetical protein
MGITPQVLCAVCLTVAAVSQPSAAAIRTFAELDRQVIIDGERAWGQAFVTRNAAEIDRLLADDFLGVDPHGKRYDKASVRNDVRQGSHLTSDEVTNIGVRFYATPPSLRQTNTRSVRHLTGRISSASSRTSGSSGTDSGVSWPPKTSTRPAERRCDSTSGRPGHDGQTV